jgi:transmembrane secretion effector
MVLGGGLLTATMCAALALTSHVLPAMLVMLITGAGSLAVMSTLMMSAQMALPYWVKARGMAITQMVFSGALTLGSLLWGAVAERTGIPLTLAIAAAGLAAASVLVLRWPLRIQEGIDLTPSVHWPPPITAERVADDRGPVMVTVEYRIDPNTRSAFSDILERLGQVRRRDGAFYWDHFVDTSDPTRHVEVFLTESWVEHLRQHERVTAADQHLQDQVAAFHTGGEPPKVTHLINAHMDIDIGTG